MIKIKITEGCAPMPSQKMPNAHNQEEARMHRTTLAHLVADAQVLLRLIEDGDDLPEWLESKITKAGDYMSSAARYIAGNEARDMGQLEESEQVSMDKAEMMKVISQRATDEQLADFLSQLDFEEE